MAMRSKIPPYQLLSLLIILLFKISSQTHVPASRRQTDTLNKLIFDPRTFHRHVSASPGLMSTSLPTSAVSRLPSSQIGNKEKDKIEKLPGQPETGVNFDQYGGYITIDAEKGRAFYYYFAEAATGGGDGGAASKPLLLWLNGGNWEVRKSGMGDLGRQRRSGGDLEANLKSSGAQPEFNQNTTLNSSNRRFNSIPTILKRLQKPHEETPTNLWNKEDVTKGNQQVQEASSGPVINSFSSPEFLLPSVQIEGLNANRVFLIGEHPVLQVREKNSTKENSLAHRNPVSTSVRIEDNH